MMIQADALFAINLWIQLVEINCDELHLRQKKRTQTNVHLLAHSEEGLN